MILAVQVNLQRAKNRLAHTFIKSVCACKLVKMCECE